LGTADSCILGIRDYEKTIDNSMRDLFQRNLGAFKRLLFIGCGDTFSDPTFQLLVTGCELILMRTLYNTMH
jgi:hypothetical protein